MAAQVDVYGSPCKLNHVVLLGSIAGITLTLEMLNREGEIVAVKDFDIPDDGAGPPVPVAMALTAIAAASTPVVTWVTTWVAFRVRAISAGSVYWNEGGDGSGGITSGCAPTSIDDSLAVGQVIGRLDVGTQHGTWLKKIWYAITHLSVTVNAGDIEIGAVEIKNDSTDDRAAVGVVTGLAESAKGLTVQAPVLGVTTGAAVQTNDNGTLQQYLRGLVALFVNFLSRLPAALGETTQALSLSVVVARNLPTLAQRHFIGKAGTAVMTGYFVDVNNLKVGSPFSASITNAAVFTFADAVFNNGSAIPAGAVDVVFDMITNDINYECVAGAATITVGNRANYPTLVAGLNMRANDVMI